jgi:hypothetical protein
MMSGVGQRHPTDDEHDISASPPTHQEEQHCDQKYQKLNEQHFQLRTEPMPMMHHQHMQYHMKRGRSHTKFVSYIRILNSSRHQLRPPDLYQIHIDNLNRITELYVRPGARVRLIRDHEPHVRAQQHLLLIRME